MCQYIYDLIKGKSVIETPIYDNMIQQLQEIHEGIQEVRDSLRMDKQLLLKELYKKDVIISAMIEKLPDMLWFKDVDGKYVYANKAIRENLLLDENPEGKTDLELSYAAKQEYGDREHTFGEICGDSDKDVLENGYTGKKYVESGKVKGKMLHMEVNKSIVKVDGEIIGVVGSGRDITEYREELIGNAQLDVFEKNEYLNKDR
jgi:PAS domain-containing protein